MKRDNQLFSGFVGAALMVVVVIAGLWTASPVSASSNAFGDKIFNPGQLKPIDSELKVAVGQIAPDFTLPSLGGTNVSLSLFKGKKNVMLTFIPAAWTPVCSDQWPGYNIAKELFDRYDTEVIGISVDNRPTLHAWTQEMGELWFNVLSDFWPHGQVSHTYGVLRSDGTAERAIFIIDKKGVIRFIHVEDINVRPDLGLLIRELQKLSD